MRLAFGLTGSAASIVAALLSGCSTGQHNCVLQDVVTISPTVATADHMDAAPGDQQQFSVYSSPEGSAVNGCAVPTYIAKLLPTWTSSDTVNVKISSANDDTNGLATCIGATNGPVTLTAVGVPAVGSVSKTLGTATLTCK